MKWLIVALVLAAWFLWFSLVTSWGMAAAHGARNYREFLVRLVRRTWQFVPFGVLLEWALGEDLAAAAVVSLIRYAAFLAACCAGAMFAVVTSSPEERKRWFDQHGQGEDEAKRGSAPPLDPGP